MARQVSTLVQPPLLDPTKLLPEDGHSLLVAGQALATWVDVFNLPLPAALDAGVTRDIDFLGDKEAAMLHHRLLEGRYERVDLLLPTFGDITPNTAKILVYGNDGQAVAAEIDYLGSLCGYLLEDEERLKKRAIAIEFSGFKNPILIRVMHPFDCLKSRVHNLTTLTAKQNIRGVAQANLAIEVQRAYFSKVLTTEDADLRQLVYPMAEAVINLASSHDGVRAFHEFGVDVMTSIDSFQFPTVFQERRWPKALQHVNRRRYGRNGKKLLPPVRDLTPPRATCAPR